MKQILAYALVIAASVLIADYAVAATAGTYNAVGSGAVLTVGTSSTKVANATAGRTDLYISNGGSNTLYCAAGPTGGGAPSPSPTNAGSNGFPIFPNGTYHASVNGGFTPAGVGLVAQSEVDCACSAASCTVSTLEY